MPRVILYIMSYSEKGSSCQIPASRSPRLLQCLLGATYGNMIPYGTRLYCGNSRSRFPSRYGMWTRPGFVRTSSPGINGQLRERWALPQGVSWGARWERGVFVRRQPSVRPINQSITGANADWGAKLHPPSWQGLGPSLAPHDRSSRSAQATTTWASFG